jgi:uncharacterized protein YndB with AHSA1/START domain
MHEYASLVAADAVRLERLLPGPIERVWAFLTESESRRRWLCAGHMDLRPGGKVELHFANDDLSREPTPAKYRGMPMSFTGTVLRCEPPRLLQFTWLESAGDSSEVTWQLEDRGERVLLTIIHRKLADRPAILSVSAGWHTHVGILEDLLGDLSPRDFWRTHSALEEEYGQRFST